MIIKGIMAYFKECPVLKENILNVDFVGENPPYFAIYAENHDKVLKKYVTGETLEQFVFSVRMRASYGRKPSENEKINLIFEEIADWVEKKNRLSEYPDIGNGKIVQRMEVLSSAHVKNTNAADCVYEMKLRAVYLNGR